MPRMILLADDSLAVHRAVEKAFRDRDDEIVVTASGDEALEALERRLPDVVLADIHMPGASGYEVASQVKAASAEIPVLLLVGTFEPLEEERVDASGADGHLMKPFDAADLVRRVDALTGTEPAEAAAVDEGETEPSDDESVEEGVEEPPGETEERDEVEEAEGVEEAEPFEEPAAPAEPPEREGGEAPIPVRLTDDDVERIARRVVGQLSTEVIERLAREVVPEVAEAAVRRRIEELERAEE